MSSKLQQNAQYEAGVKAFLQRQWFARPKPVNVAPSQLADRGAIVTGANGGLGFEVARQLIRLGVGRLIITARSQSKGDAAVARLRAEFQSQDLDIELEMLDMNSYDSIIAFAERFKAKSGTGKRIDMALLNAGIQMGSFEANAATGHETDVQVNYLSTVLLSTLLLPILKKNRGPGPNAPLPVLSIVASDTAYFAKIKNPHAPSVLAAFDDPANFARMDNYSGSKLLAIMFAETLAASHPVSRTGVIVNTSNPGLTGGTSLTGDSLLMRVAGVVMGLVARSTEAGASALVDALLVGGEERHGSYLSDWTEKPYPEIVYTEDGKVIKERLWKETMEELKFAGVAQILAEL